MKIKKLIAILEVIAEHDPQGECAIHDNKLWIAEPDELPTRAQEKLTELGTRCDPAEGWFIWA